MAKKEIYFYNPQTLQYERVRRSLTNILVRVFFFLGSVSVFATITVVIAFSFFDSPKSKRLQREIEQLTLNYSILEERMAVVDAVVKELEDRDDNLYREIFEAEPISKDVRNMGFGGSQRFEDLDAIAKGNLIKSVYENMERLERQLYVQSKSFDEIAKLSESKQEMLAAIPAITPVKSTATNVASGFGTRIDPIYKTPKFHYGMDFSGKTNTPIYATGDAKVVEISKSSRGYGNHIVLKHGFGYETSYSHLNKILVKKGQTVKRGEIIGMMGNTGKSTGTHLHYEVIKDGRKVNPLFFFYNDLSAEEYDQLIRLVDSNNQSFD